MAKIDGGCILLSRCILDSQLWSVPDGTFRIALYLLLRANHKLKYFKMIEIKRGQTCPSLKTISDDCNESVKTVRYALQLLLKMNFIKIDKPFGAQQGQRITICKYDTYQNIDNHKGTARAHEGAHEGTHEGAHNKNEKNEKNEKKKLIRYLICKFYNRRETTEWSDKEKRKLKEIIKRVNVIEELNLIMELYNSGFKFYRRDIITLLNNWTGELDKANDNKKQGVKNHGI